jgi:two-component system, LuxR family, response regulator FixJ
MPITTCTAPKSEPVHPTVYVVDDSADILDAMEVLLNSVNLKARTFPSGEAFIARIDHTARGCVLLDMRMPGMSGLEVQEALREKRVTLPIIFLTGHGEVRTAVQAMRDGALDFIEKPFHSQLLLDRVHECLKKDQETFAERSKRRIAANRLDCLTPREHEIANLIVAGKPSKVISSMMNISEKTVDVHRHNILRKISVRSVAELVQVWIEATPEPA